MTDPRSRIPGLDRLLEEAAPLLSRFPRPRVVEALRSAVRDARAAVAEGTWLHEPDDLAPYLADAAARLARDAVASLRPAVNATGVVLHTNLGRAPLAPEARAAMEAVTAGYANLEFDLETGARGSRYVHCSDLLKELTGAEDALVVNNCAAALVLALNTVAAGRRVVVSRGELVEIGGGFRIPDMLERAGARLLEVGTTNRTGVGDYRDACAGEEGVGALLKVHRSNFRIRGFTSEAGIEALAEVAREAGVPLIHDVGSGLLLDPADLGLPPEPRAADSLRQGADLAVFSGDKLLGGPQAGIVVGRGDLVAAARRNPLCRALRVDKATLAALEATLRLYRDPDTVTRRVPVLRMLTLGVDEIEARARHLAEAVAGSVGTGVAEVVPGEGRVGGGTFPDHALPTVVVRVRAPARGPDRVAARLRAGDPPVVVRIEDDAVVLDLRTVDPDADAPLAEAVLGALRPEEG